MKPGRKLEFQKAFSSLGEKPHEFSRVIDPGEGAARHRSSMRAASASSFASVQSGSSTEGAAQIDPASSVQTGR
jgi:hypothetical protein